MVSIGKNEPNMLIESLEWIFGLKDFLKGWVLCFHQRLALKGRRILIIFWYKIGKNYRDKNQYITQKILNVFVYCSCRNEINFINMVCKVAHVGDEINWGFLTREKKTLYIGEWHRDCKTAVGYCFLGKKTAIVRLKSTARCLYIYIKWKQLRLLTAMPKPLTVFRNPALFSHLCLETMVSTWSKCRKCLLR